jgi:hypothetical protein
MKEMASSLRSFGQKEEKHSGTCIEANIITDYSYGILAIVWQPRSNDLMIILNVDSEGDSTFYVGHSAYVTTLSESTCSLLSLNLLGRNERPVSAHLHPVAMSNPRLVCVHLGTKRGLCGMRYHDWDYRHYITVAFSPRNSLGRYRSTPSHNGPCCCDTVHVDLRGNSACRRYSKS